MCMGSIPILIRRRWAPQRIALLYSSSLRRRIYKKFQCTTITDKNWAVPNPGMPASGSAARALNLSLTIWVWSQPIIDPFRLWQGRYLASLGFLAVCLMALYTGD